MIAEIFIPSFGILGIGGFIAFIIGSVLLVDSGNDQGLRISWLSILPGALAVASFGGLVAFLVYKTEKSKPQSGVDVMVGKEVEALTDFTNGRGQVKVDGEIWTAITGEEDVRKGDILCISEVDGLKIILTAKR